MNDNPVNLDEHRGMAAQKATDLRRGLQKLQIEQLTQKTRQQEFEALLEKTPADTQQAAVIKARYLVQLYGETREGSEPHRSRLIAQSLEELDRLFGLAVPTNET